MFEFAPLMQLIAAIRGAPAQPERSGNNETFNLMLQLLLAIFQFRDQRSFNAMGPVAEGTGGNIYSFSEARQRRASGQ